MCANVRCPTSKLSRQKSIASIILTLCIIALAFVPSVQARDYQLAPGDRVAITVFGNTELSGEFSIDQSGRIFYPVIGAIELGGLNVKETEQRIATALNDGILVKPSVFVRVAEFRPIQVIGDVRNSGSFPFRAGTIVKSAIGVAGGYGVSLLTPGTAAAEFLAAEERLKLLQNNAWRLLVRQARLSAQISGADRFDAPAIAGVPEAELAKVVDDENRHLAQQTEARKNKVELLRSQREPMAAENTAIDAQIANERKQLDIIVKQIKSYERLQQSGLARYDIMIQLQLNAATKESMIGRLEGEKSRLRSGIGELELRVQDAEQEYIRLASAERLDVGQKLSELDASIPLAQQARRARLREVGGNSTIGIKHQFFISRLKDGATQTVEVSDNDLIEPGDIIEVRTELSELKTAADANAEPPRSSQ